MKRGYLLLAFAFLLVLVPLASSQSVPRDFILEVEKGNIPGHDIVIIRGHSHSIGASEQIIWDIAANYMFPAGPTQMNVSSTDTDDVVGGSGLWNLTVEGLNFAGVEINETIQMNGQNPVGTVNQYFRINRLVGLEGGSSGGNEGDVYIGVGAPAAGVPSAGTYNMIEETRGNSLCGVYSLPVNHTAFLIKGRAGTADNKIVSFSLLVKSMCFDNQVWRYLRHIQVDQQFVYFEGTEMICQRADILLRSEAASADTNVEMYYKLLLVDNDVLNNSTLSWEDGTPDEIVISSDPVNINIESSEVDLLSQIPIVWMFFASLATITLATPRMIENKQLRLLSYPLGVILWVCAAYIWAIEYVGTGFFPIVYVHLVPIMIQATWGFLDNAESLAEESSKKTKYLGS